MAYALKELLNVADGQVIAEMLLAQIAAVAGTAGDGIKAVEVDGGKLKVYKTADKSDTPSALDLPAEYFLDQTKTAFVQSFNFAGGNYAGATDPGLDGKPVMVLAVKGTDANGTETVTYSFVNLAALVDVYTSGSPDELEITGGRVTLNVASTGAVREMVTDVINS